MTDEYDFTHDLALIRLTAEQKQKNYRLSKVLKQKGEKYMFGTLDDIYNNIQKGKLAEILNLFNAFITKAKALGLSSCFITPTLKPKYNITDKQNLEQSEKELSRQFEIFNKFFSSILDARFFKNPEKNKKHYQRQKEDWLYCPSDKRPYIKTFELTKIYNAHLHFNMFLPSSDIYIVELCKLLEQKIIYHDIGRTVCIFEPRFKKPLTDYLNLVIAFQDEKKNTTYYRPSRNTADKIKFESGSGFIFGFYDHSRSVKEQIMAYVLKYVLKSLNAHKSSESANEKIDDFAYRAKAVFLRLSRRPFTYSKNFLFPLTKFRKAAPAVKCFGDKYKNLGFWTIMQDKGEIRIETDKNEKNQMTGFRIYKNLTIEGQFIEWIFFEWQQGKFELKEMDDIYWQYVDWSKIEGVEAQNER